MRICGKSCIRSIAPAFKLLTLITGLIVPGEYVQAQLALPTASPSQVATAIHDCLESEGYPDALGKRNWRPEQMPPSGSAMRKYVSRTNPAWMPVPDKPGGETICWVIARAADERSKYEQSIGEVVGAKTNIGATGTMWLTKSHAFVLDWFSEQGLNGMRIEVHRIRP
ncbi:hypothetical protein [Sphingomonas pituitosa]|uniref:hypothetical protein n=1 Tax=Sphingomonas pituitosa TaxID=99597 RepID=UPI0012ED2609|nr:hypothetical protein [Sphingomonas pituitosa]